MQQVVSLLAFFIWEIAIGIYYVYNIKYVSLKLCLTQLFFRFISKLFVEFNLFPNAKNSFLLLALEWYLKKASFTHWEKAINNLLSLLRQTGNWIIVMWLTLFLHETVQRAEGFWPRSRSLERSLPEKIFINLRLLVVSIK